MVEFKDSTKSASVYLEKLKFKISEMGPRISSGIVSLRGAIGDPKNMREGELFHVDLDIPVFQLESNGQVIASGACQVVGTYLSTNKSWVWGYRNPSIPAKAHSRIEHFVSQSETLEGIAQCDRFEIDEQFAVEFAGYIAVTAGWRGVWPVHQGDAIVMLAMNLSMPPGDQDTPFSKFRWCSFCGIRKKQCKTLLAAGDVTSICDVCIQTLADRLSFLESECPEELMILRTSDYILFAYCICCEERKDKMVTVDGHAGVCPSCIQQCIDALEQ